MGKLYRFVFYLLYEFMIRIGRRDIPESKAIVIFTLWECFYLLLPYALLRYVTGANLKIPKAILISGFVAFASFNFFYMIYSKRFVNIYKEFENDKDFANRYKVIVSVVFLSFPILIMLLFTFTIWK